MHIRRIGSEQAQNGRNGNKIEVVKRPQAHDQCLYMFISVQKYMTIIPHSCRPVKGFSRVIRHNPKIGEAGAGP